MEGVFEVNRLEKWAGIQPLGSLKCSLLGFGLYLGSRSGSCPQECQASSPFLD